MCKIKCVMFNVSLAGILIISAGCLKPAEKEKETEKIPVRVEQVKLQDIYETIDYVGNVKANEEAVVYPKVSGKIIEKVKEDNAPVKKFEAIAYIDRDETGLKFEKAPVESPLTGVVGRVFVDIGTKVTTATAIAIVVDMDKVKINLDIPEKYLGSISLQQEARIKVDAFGNEEFSGRVTKISPVVDLNTRTAPIEITLDNPDHRLKSGMFAKVSLILKEKKNVPVILKEAILGKEPESYVFVIQNNQAFLKKVSLGIRQGPYYEVINGLIGSEDVVIMGQQRLYEGAAVLVEEEK
ncbi:MAG: efflux RND transporter periplasmic adaptor subunit [Candidatus Omnitrophica bacterium]|nr:efflux RND transporter periplasmic adaptor subunit [Candidatus Omnitrophota bacterium]